MSSHQRSQRGRPSLVPLDADATDARPTMQGRVRPDASGFVFSSSSLSSVDDDEPVQDSPPQHHDTRQHKHAPLPPESLQKKGADSGHLVWVRVTKSGKLASNSERGDSEEELEGCYWWPAFVTEGRLTAGPLTVSLYGEISPAVARSVRIASPSPSHVLSFKRPGQDITRFNSITFRCPEPGSQRASPSKRPRTALDDAWRSAVDLAHEADASLNDGLPSNLSSYKVGTVRMHESKVEMPTREAEVSTELSQTLSEQWSPPPCDPLLEIPGELVFSLARKGRTEYWAAKVEEYLVPKTPSVAPKYRVRFKDDTICTVSRDMFYTSDEPEFYTCNLGQYVDDEEETDVDSDDDHVQYEISVDERPAPMPPPNPEDFCEMSICDQFAYVKPVIKAILNETYLPVRERHQAFMRGGASRRRLQKTATGKGDLTTREVSRLGKDLQQWVLGPSHFQIANLHPSHIGDLESESGLSTWTEVQVEQVLPFDSPDCLNSTLLSPRPSLESLLTDTGPSEPLRPVGSSSYEALSESDKLQYCLLVLFHEATLQLLLWRSGERRSLNLLSQDDEERLRLIGLAKSEERAWVEEISRLRKMKRKPRGSGTSSPTRHTTIRRSLSGRTLRSRNPPYVG